MCIDIQILKPLTILFWLYFSVHDIDYTCFNRIEKSRKAGGLGEMKIPLLADKSMVISRAYGVLKVFTNLFIDLLGT